MTASVRRFEAAEWALYRDLRRSALRDSPDAFASTYEASLQIPDVEWQRRLEQVHEDESLPLLALHAGRPVGLAWGAIDQDDAARVHLYQMWVDPRARGLGIGRLLLESFIDWAERRFSVAVLGVTCGNEAACRLYESAGFVPFGDPEPLRVGSDLNTQNMELRFR